MAINFPANPAHNDTLTAGNVTYIYDSDKSYWKIFSSVDSAAGSLTLTNNLTVGGTMVSSGLTYPTTDGTAGQGIITNGSGTLSFTNLFDGNYSSLSGAPTTVSSFTNDAGYITGYTVTQSDVTAHQAALSITESQISDLGTYLTAEADTLNTVTGRGATTTNSITVGNLTTNGNIVVTGTVDGRDIATDGTKLDGIETGAQVNVGTNLGNTATGTSFTITSSTGNNTNLPAATTAAWGMMTDEDKTKLDGIETGAQVNVGTNLGNTATGTSFTITSSTGNNTNLPAATTSAWGMMTDEDKTKLDGIEASADVTDAGNVNPLIDAHLNTSTAATNEVLSWNGSDYDWVAQSGGGGGITTGKAIAMAIVFG